MDIKKFSENILLNLSDMVVIASLDHNILEVNNAVCNTLKYDREELLNQSLSKIIEGFILISALDLDDITEINSYQNIETNFISKDGGKIPVLLSISNIEYSEKDTKIAVYLARDITERKETEQALWSSETKYKKLLNEYRKQIMQNAAVLTSCMDGFAIMSEDGKIQVINDSLSDMLKYSGSEVIGKNISKFVSDELKKDFKSHLNITVKKKYIRFETELIGKEGDVVISEISSHYMIVDRRPIFFIFVRDITEQKKLQEQLIHSAKLSAVGQLAAGIAHEFKNILSVIMGFIQVLASTDEKPDDFDDILKIMGNETKRGNDIVSDMMLFSRPKNPKKEICYIQFVIDTVLRLQQKMFTINSIEVVKDFQKTSMVSVDIGQIQQVLLNLCINAIHAMQPNGSGTLTIKVYEVGNELKISFSDDGIGMEKQTKLKIFEPFFTTKKTDEESGTAIAGTGLGLSITYSIIKNHNGKIFVETEKGRGTTFIIMLPTADINSEN